MKKVIKIIGVLIVLAVVGVICVFFFLGSIVKKGVETVGPKVTKTEVKLDGATLSLFSGSGELKGFLVGNPEGFKSPAAIKVGSTAVQVQPGSVMSSKVVVRSVKLVAPEITLEATLSGNNLTKLLDNIKGSAEKDKQATTKKEQSSSKKLQVDDFLMTGAKVTGSAMGWSGTLPVPDIHLTNLGQGENGITAAELSEKVFAELVQSTLKAVGEKGADLGKLAGTNAVQTIEKATKGIGDLFKKK